MTRFVPLCLGVLLAGLVVARPASAQSTVTITDLEAQLAKLRDLFLGEPGLTQEADDLARVLLREVGRAVAGNGDRDAAALVLTMRRLPARLKHEAFAKQEAFDVGALDVFQRPRSYFTLIET